MRATRKVTTDRRWKLLLSAISLSILLLGSCGPAIPPTATPGATGQPAAGQQATIPATVPVIASPTTVAPTVVPPGNFVNPVLTNDFADPAILHAGDSYYGYATNANGKNVQVARSSDLVNWTLLPDAMPALPSWAQLGGSFVWAPEVIQLGDRFVLYYTARDAKADKQCIGVATAAKPEGKFKDTRDQPLVCNPDEGGDIDPSPFRDGDKLYLYWKNDGNCCGITTWIYAQELAPDGLSLVGQPTRLVQNDQPWEGRVIEGPAMLKHENGYYLFFSANNYATVDYAVGYATCQSATGPCQEAPENPVLKSRLEKQPLVIGPGGEEFVQVGDQTWIVYHAWNIVGGTRGDSRFMWLDRLDWQNGKPVVKGPTTDPEPAPGTQ